MGETGLKGAAGWFVYRLGTADDPGDGAGGKTPDELRQPVDLVLDRDIAAGDPLDDRGGQGVVKA